MRGGPTTAGVAPEELLPAGAVFHALPAEVREELGAHLVREEWRPGTVILREGDAGDRYYLVETGEVEVWAGRHGPASVPAPGEPWEPEPSEQVLVGRLGPGEGFGEMALVLGGERRASVRAAGPVVVRSLDRGTFDHVVHAHPGTLLSFETGIAMRQAATFLGESSPFAGQPPELLRWLALRMTSVELATGDAAVREGEPGDAFYVVRSGRVEVVAAHADGGEYAIAELGPGEPFGEQALVSDGPRTATVRALEPTQLLRLAREDFVEVLARYDDRARYVLLLARQRARPRRAEHVAVAPAPGKEGAYVLKDTERFRYLRMSEPGLFLWNLMDGEHTVRDLALAYFERYRRFGVDAVLQTIVELHVAGLVEVPDADARLMRRIEHPNPLQRGLVRLEPYIRHTFSVPDPDRLLALLYRYVARPLYLRPVQLLLLALAVVGTALFVRALFTPHAASAGAGGIALYLFLGFELQVVLHELGHALTTKHFGREVHRAGVGWYFFSPVAFVDTSDMWLEGRRPRMLVAAAGPYVNVLLGSLSGILLLVAGGREAAFLLTFATTGYTLALLNLNPLYELDGYYVLSDWLDIANLRAKALAFLGTVIWRVPSTTDDRRLRRIFTTYSVAALGYAGFAAVALLFGYQRLVRHLVGHVLPAVAAAALGWLLAGTMAALLLFSLWQALRRRVHPERAITAG